MISAFGVAESAYLLIDTKYLTLPKDNFCCYMHQKLLDVKKFHFSQQYLFLQVLGKIIQTIRKFPACVVV